MRPPWSSCSRHPAGRCGRSRSRPSTPARPTAIARFVDAGVAVAVGHTGADFETALAAFGAGASILTHAFNGMRGIHHRAPGPVVAAMHADHVTLEVINDGVHVHPDVVRLAFAGAHGRVALVTDAMAAAGAADGAYRLGSLGVIVEGGIARLLEGGSIAGSTLTQDAALRRAVVDCGIPLDEAVGALTVAPAAAIGRAHDLGRLDPGYAADAVLLTPDLTSRPCGAREPGSPDAARAGVPEVARPDEPPCGARRRVPHRLRSPARSTCRIDPPTRHLTPASSRLRLAFGHARRR